MSKLMQKTLAAGGVVVAAVLAPVAAHADMATAIADAQSEGISSVTLAVGAVIAVAAVAMGFSIIRGIISR